MRSRRPCLLSTMRVGLPVATSSGQEGLVRVLQHGVHMLICMIEHLPCIFMTICRCKLVAQAS